jgi:hypothetical protein
MRYDYELPMYIQTDTDDEQPCLVGVSIHEHIPSCGEDCGLLRYTYDILDTDGNVRKDWNRFDDRQFAKMVSYKLSIAMEDA